LASLIANNSELFTEQQFRLQCKIKTAELSDSKQVQELKNQSHSKGRVSELTNGVGNNLRHRLSSDKEIYDSYWTAVDETVGVTSIAQPAVSV